MVLHVCVRTWHDIVLYCMVVGRVAGYVVCIVLHVVSLGCIVLHHMILYVYVLFVVVVYCGAQYAMVFEHVSC